MTVVANWPLRCGRRMLWSLPIPHCECGDDLVEAPAVGAAAEAESYVKTGIWVAVTTWLWRGMSLRRRCCEKTPSIHSSQTPLRHSCVHTLPFLSNSFLSFPLLGYVSFNHTNSLTGLRLTSYLPPLFKFLRLSHTRIRASFINLRCCSDWGCPSPWGGMEHFVLQMKFV